jgi:thiol-disulfide isomerase/thioredoxin
MIKGNMNKVVVSLIIFGIFFLSSCSQSNSDINTAVQLNGINKGQIPPDFSIKTIEGNEIKLSDFKGNKPVLLYFWASWCPYCKQDLRIVKDIYPMYKDKVNFVAIDLDTNEDAELIANYKEKMGLSGIDFAQGDPKVLSDYAITHTTTKYAIGKNGMIIYKGSGVFSKEQWEILLNSLATSS